MSKPLDIIGMMRLLGPWFPGGSWGAWHAIMNGAFALPMSVAEIELFFEMARRAPPKRRVRELWVIGGRRGGKDSAASLMAAHAAALFDQEGKLRPGERAVVLCVACDRGQARIVLGYIKSYFNDVPALKANVRRVTSDGIELNNGIDIVVGTNRSVRGRAVLFAILDECAFFKSNTSSSPDIETYRAIMPGMATLRGSMLVGISSPYRKHGLLHQKFERHAFAKFGIRYEHSQRDRSALYLDCLPLFTSGRARLLDNKRLVTQFGCRLGGHGALLLLAGTGVVAELEGDVAVPGLVEPRRSDPGREGAN